MTKYAIITVRTISHPSDERSRTYPGHGYPAYTENVDEFKTYDSVDQLKKAIIQLKNTSFKVYEIKELTVTTTIEVKLND